jgi:hypothetical protein
MGLGLWEVQSEGGKVRCTRPGRSQQSPHCAFWTRSFPFTGTLESMSNFSEP